MIRRSMDKADDSNDPLKGAKNVLIAVVIISAIMFIAPALMEDEYEIDASGTIINAKDAADCTTKGGDWVDLRAEGAKISNEKCIKSNPLVKMSASIELGAKSVLNVMKWVVLAVGVAVVVGMRVKPRHIQIPTP